MARAGVCAVLRLRLERRDNVIVVLVSFPLLDHDHVVALPLSLSLCDFGCSFFVLLG